MSLECLLVLEQRELEKGGKKTKMNVILIESDG